MNERTEMLRFGLACVAIFAVVAGCAVPPKAADQPAFRQRVGVTTGWFERSVVGLREQVTRSGGYVVFPEPVQWGMLFSGGTYGRGAVCRPDGSQIGWASIGTGSIGLQAGIQKFRMLVIFEDQEGMKRFQNDRLFGSANGVAVAGEEGASTRMPFQNGVVIYEGASEGLMAGVSVGLNLIRYEPLQRGEVPTTIRSDRSAQDEGPMTEGE